ncbi:MAG: hypothetical protein ABIS18_03115 [Actinomycetota bacterium]
MLVLADDGKGVHLKNRIRLTMLFTTLPLLAMVLSPASATHGWSFHWARPANPFTVVLRDNVSPKWEGYLTQASWDWSASSVLNTVIVPVTADVNNCSLLGPSLDVARLFVSVGTVEVCNANYGLTGWLGLAVVLVSDNHIVSGHVKLNDSYFSQSTYNTVAWKRLVTCQEVGHTLGLFHVDENFANPNLGTCMDYTNSPLGPPSNEHPNTHDYDQLEASYTHLDGSGTPASAPEAAGWANSSSTVVDVDKHGNGTVTWIRWIPR